MTDEPGDHYEAGPAIDEESAGKDHAWSGSGERLGEKAGEADMADLAEQQTEVTGPSSAASSPQQIPRYLRQTPSSRPSR